MNEDMETAEKKIMHKLDWKLTIQFAERGLWLKNICSSRVKKKDIDEIFLENINFFVVFVTQDTKLRSFKKISFTFLT